MSTWSIRYCTTWSGFAFSGSTAGVMASSGEMKYKLHKVAPEQDTSTVAGHGAMKDSHKDRTFTTISDGALHHLVLTQLRHSALTNTILRQTGADGTVYN